MFSCDVSWLSAQILTEQHRISYLFKARWEKSRSSLRWAVVTAHLSACLFVFLSVCSAVCLSACGLAQACPTTLKLFEAVPADAPVMCLFHRSRISCRDIGGGTQCRVTQDNYASAHLQRFLFLVGTVYRFTVVSCRVSSNPTTSTGCLTLILTADIILKLTILESVFSSQIVLIWFPSPVTTELQGLWKMNWFPFIWCR